MQMIFTEQLEKELAPGRRYALITDEQVKEKIGNALFLQLRQAGFDVSLIVFPSGEKHKTRATKEWIEDQLLALNFGRDCMVIGLGGGVVTDLVGFVAATFCRGVPFIAVPTTLLGMVDASIGGKTGVNTPHGKNLIGAFYPPHQILMVLSFLHTMPEKEWKNGMAEIIKHAAIASPRLFKELEEGQAKWKQKDPLFLETIIRKSIEIKTGVIRKDPYETGLRAILNFGHTIGHAIEAATDYEESHGAAVAWGMIAEAEISCQLGILKREDIERLSLLIMAYGFQKEWPDCLNKEHFEEALFRDKKNQQGKLRMVLLEEIGKVVEGYCREVSLEMVMEQMWSFTR